MKKRKLPLPLIVGIIAITALCVYFAYQLLVVDKKPIQTADKSQIRTANVIQGDFQEYFQVNGFVSPARSMFIDAQENGIVEYVYKEQGDVVAKAEVLLKLKNDDLESQRLLKETSLKNETKDLEDMALRFAQAAVRNRQEILEIDHRIDLLQDDFNQKEYQYRSAFISERELRSAEKELKFWREKREIALRAHELDLALLERDKERMEKTIEMLGLDLRRIEKRIGTLTVASPAYGQITVFNASVGESKTGGSRLVQLDIMDTYKMTANLDEYYLPDTKLGTKGSFTYLDEKGDETDFMVTVSWISPDVRNNSFEVEFDFDKPPSAIRIGQRFPVRVALGETRKSLMLEQGPFFQTGGGAYVYVVDPSGNTARKRTVVIGKSNPEYLQVVDGLQAGEKVVVSDYTGFHGLSTIAVN